MEVYRHGAFEEQKARLSVEAATKPDAREREQTATYAEFRPARADACSQLSPDLRGDPLHVAKGIKPTNRAVADGEDGTIHLPAVDAQGQQWTTRYIQDDGTKQFAKDSRKQDCFHVLNGMLADREKAPMLMIGEGYAVQRHGALAPVPVIQSHGEPH